MRSLDEYKAEIIHRSEVKIKQRKKMRNRILAACVPVCLCVVIGAVGAFSGVLDVKSDSMAAAPESAGWNNNGFGMMAEDMAAEENCVISDNSLNQAPGVTQDSENPQYSESTFPVITSKLTITPQNCADYEILKEMLLNLDYAPHRVCRCLPQYKLETDFGEFGIHLSQGYARCEEGQAKLTAEQLQTLRQILTQLMNQ